MFYFAKSRYYRSYPIWRPWINIWSDIKKFDQLCKVKVRPWSYRSYRYNPWINIWSDIKNFDQPKTFGTYRRTIAFHTYEIFLAKFTNFEIVCWFLCFWLNLKLFWTSKHVMIYILCQESIIYYILCLPEQVMIHISAYLNKS